MAQATRAELVVRVALPWAIASYRSQYKSQNISKLIIEEDEETAAEI
jgi:hypothetical protein